MVELPVKEYGLPLAVKAVDGGKQHIVVRCVHNAALAGGRRGAVQFRGKTPVRHKGQRQGKNQKGNQKEG